MVRTMLTLPALTLGPFAQNDSPPRTVCLSSTSHHRIGCCVGSDRGIDYFHRLDIERFAINRQFNNSGGLVMIR